MNGTAFHQMKLQSAFCVFRVIHWRWSLHPALKMPINKGKKEKRTYFNALPDEAVE